MKFITDYMEKAQVDTILEDAKACNIRDYLIIWMFRRSGVRASELLNIRPKDIEFHNQSRMSLRLSKASNGGSSWIKKR